MAEAGGRPTKYDATFAAQAEKLCELGATDDNLADFFGVSVRTIARWKIEHAEFCQALKTGKVGADDRVERSLFQKAVGYTFDSEKVFQHSGEIVRTPIREHVPPDTTACIFWLKNRRPDLWRDKREIEHSNRTSDMSDDELARIAASGGSGASEASSDKGQLH